MPRESYKSWEGAMNQVAKNTLGVWMSLNITCYLQIRLISRRLKSNKYRRVECFKLRSSGGNGTNPLRTSLPLV